MQKVVKKRSKQRQTRVAVTLPTCAAKALNKRLQRYSFLLLVVACKFSNFFRQTQKILEVGAQTKKQSAEQKYVNLAHKEALCCMLLENTSWESERGIDSRVFSE